ncbi:MAG: ADP-ribosylglycohydrolase family protein [Lactobacillaceae bacterium]|jgi:ADP-ribosylglycohydrolase|nr:ADP-ribosylglycohydrolase family protein [Lactobacillaceae bacterium]
MNNAKKLMRAVTGLAIGDAYGLPYQFKARDTFEITDAMVGGGSFDMPKGTWSDDTSMTLATIDALADGYDAETIMRAFEKWFNSEAYLPGEQAFDVGNGTTEALKSYAQTGEFGNFDADNEMNNGNGALMRIMPLAFYEIPSSMTLEQAIDEISGLTHGPQRSKLSARFWVYFMRMIGRGLPLERAMELAMQRLNAMDGISALLINEKLSWLSTATATPAELIATIKNKVIDEVPSSGYVVDTLLATLWVLLNTDDFKQAIMLATELGDDTDTITGLVGQAAVFMYSDIPADWIRDLRGKTEIEQVLNVAVTGGKFE